MKPASSFALHNYPAMPDHDPSHPLTKIACCPCAAYCRFCGPVATTAGVSGKVDWRWKQQRQALQLTSPFAPPNPHFSATRATRSRSSTCSSAAAWTKTHARCFSASASMGEAAPERDVMEYDVVTVGAGPAVNTLGRGQRGIGRDELLYET